MDSTINIFFNYCNEQLEAVYFINKNIHFGSWFWRFKVREPYLVMALLLAQSRGLMARHREHVFGNIHLLIVAFRPLTFNVIIGIVGFKSTIFLFLFYLFHRSSFFFLFSCLLCVIEYI